MVSRVPTRTPMPSVFWASWLTRPSTVSTRVDVSTRLSTRCASDPIRSSTWPMRWPTWASCLLISSRTQPLVAHPVATMSSVADTRTPVRETCLIRYLL